MLLLESLLLAAAAKLNNMLAAAAARGPCSIMSFSLLREEDATPVNVVFDSFPTIDRCTSSTQDSTQRMKMQRLFGRNSVVFMEKKVLESRFINVLAKWQ